MKSRTGSSNMSADDPEGIELLGEEFARDPVPEKLLELARELQRALEARLESLRQGATSEGNEGE